MFCRDLAEIPSSSERTQERYFYNEFLTYGKYQFPYVRKQSVDLDTLNLIRFSDTVPREKEATDATVHFFEYEIGDAESYLREQLDA